MKRVSIPWSALVVLGSAGLLLFYPGESTAAARDGLSLCLDLMIPSLFPFFVLSSLFVSLNLAAIPGKFLEKGMSPLFRVSGTGASALLLGFLGGYPVGMRTTAQLYGAGQCTKEDAIRLSIFCNNCGPAFLLSVTGIGIFHSRTIGFLLFGTHILAALFTGFAYRLLHPHVKKKTVANASPCAKAPSFSGVFPDCVRDSFTATLNVSAFVILFSVLIHLATCSGLLPKAIQLLQSLFHLPDGLCRSLLIGVFELSTGVSALADDTASPFALPLAAFLLGWGGLSVHCQSLPFLRQCDLPLRPYLLGKLTQGIIAAVLTFLLAPLFPTVAFPTADAVSVFSPTASLVRQESLALWGLAGCYFLLFRQNRTRKTSSTSV